MVVPISGSVVEIPFHDVVIQMKTFLADYVHMLLWGNFVQVLLWFFWEWNC